MSQLIKAEEPLEVGPLECIIERLGVISICKHFETHLLCVSDCALGNSIICDLCTDARAWCVWCMCVGMRISAVCDSVWFASVRVWYVVCSLVCVLCMDVGECGVCGCM